MLLVRGTRGEKGRTCGSSKPGAPDRLPVKCSFFLAHCGLIYLRMRLLLLYIIEKPKKAIILQQRRQEKPLGTQGLSANHYVRLAQGWQLGSRFMTVSHGP